MFVIQVIIRNTKIIPIQIHIKRNIIHIYITNVTQFITIF